MSKFCNACKPSWVDEEQYNKIRISARAIMNKYQSKHFTNLNFYEGTELIQQQRRLGWKDAHSFFNTSAGFVRATFSV